MSILIMRITHWRQADLNLLVVFAALAEERNVTRAAGRLLLSQPAVSRALQRLREMFHDDLLVRTPEGYEPTPKGQRLLHELESALPRLERLLSGSEFDPETEESTFRIAGSDHASQVLCPLLCRSVLPRARKVYFEFLALHDETFDAMERGRLDLILNAEDMYIPARFATEVIFEDGFACVVAKKSRFSRELTLRQYLAANHIGVGISGREQMIPDKRLASVGAKRHCPMWVPYFSTAMRSIAGTDLIATVPARMAAISAGDPALRVIRAPDVFGRFRYLMAWHPRMNTDAAHLWLRSVVREAAASLSGE
jgi:DNA-binding transcriptional LysR family regulator